MVQLEAVESRKLLRGQLTWFLSWVVITAIGIYLNPSPAQHGTHRQLGLPSCPSVIFFDRPCPGCGMTTSWSWMVRARLVEAFQCNAFGPILYLAFTASALACGWYWFKKVRFDTNTRPMNWALGVLVIFFASYGVIRFFAVKLNDPHSIVGMPRSTMSKEGGQSPGVPEQNPAP